MEDHVSPIVETTSCCSTGGVVSSEDYGKTYERLHGHPVGEEHLLTIERVKTVLKGPIEIDAKSQLFPDPVETRNPRTDRWSGSECEEDQS